ncbi:unnamed protein product [Rotaria magnacalcarata]|uniref:Methyltransferase domain-containing protein n=2 Tax=Rotaria magnacalcarata TaxID=392030 RepID=A0A816CAS5_9BILA|nr:unnamed protein product [Rotaria magnacalcarata]CAF2126276.1 unnamed protein product [Rotaria magnacalcarata]CAF4586156.1 unnamed protein product [Rotaria magnacalcarata]
MELRSTVVITTISLLAGFSILFLWNGQSCSRTQLLFNNDCRLSLIESDNFICESDAVWNERKIVYQTQDKENMMKRSHKIFFLSNWEPNFHCSHARRIGQMGDGGKWVCDPHRLKARSDCLIYSAGSNGDFSFEVHMKKVMPHCEIHTFDQNRHVCPNNICVFHQITFGNGTHPNNSKSWTTILEELGHTQRKIDVLKIDIEGGEYSFFPFLMQSPTKSLPQQILVEVHPNNPNNIHAFFELLRTYHYVIFNKEPNLLAGHEFFEFALLKLNPQFFNSLPTNATKK